MSQPQEFPPLDVTELRPYLPALRLAERAITEHAEGMAESFEDFSQPDYDAKWR